MRKVLRVDAHNSLRSHRHLATIDLYRSTVEVTRATDSSKHVLLQDVSW